MKKEHSNMSDLIQVTNKIEEIDQVIRTLESKGLRERNGYLRVNVNKGEEPKKWAFIAASREKLTTFKMEVKANQVIRYEQELNDIGLVKFVDYFTIGSGEFRSIHLLGGTSD